MKLSNPKIITDFAPQMIDFHLQQAENWAFQLAKLANPHDKEILRRQFEQQCQQTVYKLRGHLSWKK